MKAFNKKVYFLTGKCLKDEWVVVMQLWFICSILPTMGTSILPGLHTTFFFFAFRKVSLFYLFACNKGNSRHLHAGLEDVTDKNCLQKPYPLMLIDRLTLLYI